MAMIISISDYHKHREHLQIAINNNNIAAIQSVNEGTVSGSRPIRRLKIVLDVITAAYFIRELKEFTQFRQRLCTNPALRDLDILWIQIVPAKKEFIDFKWDNMLAHSIWEKIEVDYLMSWLSTLGGGFSALGEQFSRCAETAGKISLKQLTIGLRLGDPFLQARCKLYYSISLIQIGRLRSAKYIVRDQYRFARPHKEYDGRLVKMCKGIWLRIQYEYGLRLAEQERRRNCGCGDA